MQRYVVDCSSKYYTLHLNLLQILHYYITTPLIFVVD